MFNNKNIFILACLANGVCFSMILPLLAPIVRHLQLSELHGGAIVSIGALFMVIAAVLISKKQQLGIFQLLCYGFAGMALTWGLFSLSIYYGLTVTMSATVLFGLLMLTRASTGIFMAMPQIALQTYIMTRYETEQSRSQHMAFFGALNSVGVVLGPFITTVFLVWGLMAPLWVAVLLLTLISILIIVYFDRKDIPVIAATDVNSLSLQDQQVSIHKALPWLVLGFSLYLAIVTVNLTAGFYIQDHFQTSVMQGAVYFSQCSMIAGIALVAMQTAIAKFLKWRVQQLLWCGLMTMLAGLILAISTDHIRIFQSGYLLFGISVACLIPAFTTGTAETGPQHFQAKLAAWCTATQALSFVIGPMLSTGLYEWRATSPYYFLIGLMLILMGYFAAFYRRAVVVSLEN